jgi:peptidoglycan-N-acetylmuramic acid deacetylase
MRIKKLVLLLVAYIDIAAIIFLAITGYAADVFYFQAAHSEGAVYSWYYKPRTDGIQPAAEKDFEFVYNYNAYSAGSPEEKIIYLTFDAGYENGYTPKILDTLKAHNVPAAFFVVKHYIKSSPELVSRMAAEGHLVCNHSANHKDMAAMSDIEAFKKELSDNEEAFFEATGKVMPKYFRPPEGKFSERCLKYAQQLGYTTVFWSFAYKDWYTDNQPDHASAFKTIISRTHPGEIALLHATSKTNAEILDRVITEWKNMGYTFKSLNHLIRTYDPAK